jgi:hypothetical protein
MTSDVEATVAQSDNIETVTDSANPVDNDATETKSDNTAPSVEVRDGKYFIEGIGRVYLRDDVNKISANAKRDVEHKLLQELNVDSIDSVKSVVQTLQESTPTSEGEASLNVNSLRDAVKKREATVEELTSQVNTLKTELLLKDHMGSLLAEMPSTWSTEQKDSVVTLMRAKNMIAVEGDTFAIRNGDDYLTTDGEKPDYAAAVELVGKQWLGLPFGKKGVEVQYGDTSKTSADSGKSKPVDDARLESDAEYRGAYTTLRKTNMNLRKSDVTHNMIIKQVEKQRNRFSR